MSLMRTAPTALLALAMTTPLSAQAPAPRAVPPPHPLLSLQTPAVPTAPVAPAAPPGTMVPATPFVRVGPQAPSPAPMSFDHWNLYQRPFALTHTDSSARSYEQARAAIERNQYDRALTLLDQVIGGKGRQADAAMYWKAYSQARIGRRADALTTIADMQKQFPKSPWSNDARALDVEIRQASGQALPADALPNEELRLLALGGLIQHDQESALPTIERILTGTSSLRVKDQALFVLSRNSTPKARTVVLGVARGSANPELQLRAIRYLGMMGGTATGDALDEVYRTTPDDDVKRAILRSYATSGARDKLLALATSESSSTLREVVVQQLGALGAATELADLYRSADQAPGVRRSIIDALAGAGSAAILVNLARAEKDLELKKAIVTRLSTMQSQEARDYMVELLK